MQYGDAKFWVYYHLVQIVYLGYLISSNSLKKLYLDVLIMRQISGLVRLHDDQVVSMIPSQCEEFSSFK